MKKADQTKTRVGIISSVLLLFGLFTAPALAQDNSASEEPAQSTPVSSPLVETEIFANPGHFGNPKLSPDGNRIVYRQQLGGKTFLTAEILYEDAKQSIAIPDNRDLAWYRWAGNSKILLSVSGVLNTKFGERRHTGLFVKDLVTGQTRTLGRKRQGFDGANVLYVDPTGTYILLSMQQSVYHYPGVYRIELDTNEITRILGPQSQIWTWIADNRGVVRMGLSFVGSTLKIRYRRTADEKFKLIGKIKEKDDLEEALLDITHIVSEADEGYILSNEETGRFALYEFNYLTRETGKMVFGHDENDITGFDLNDAGTALESVYYTDSRDRIKWFNEDLAEHQRKLELALPGQEAWIHSKSRDGRRMIVFVTSSTDPGSYYLYEPELKKLIWFASLNSKLDPGKLSKTEYVKYAARDGTEIPAYLTLPKNRAAEKLPLIILPHGGPYGIRDTLDYNVEVQFLANRGYAVLQPNYRGSDSYGEAFYKKGSGQIGRAMQDDLDDGMDWLVQRGIVDPARVCLVGGSYGGYAALWGVTRNPERYRCAASFAGVTDWNKQLKYDGRFLKSRYKREWRDTVEGEEKFDLDTVSPARLAANLHRPVLIAHGTEDSNVPFSQFKLYRSALEKARKDAVYIAYDSEGHGFSDPKNEKDWLDRLEAFLYEHNPAY